MFWNSPTERLVKSIHESLNLWNEFNDMDLWNFKSKSIFYLEKFVSKECIISQHSYQVLPVSLKADIETDTNTLCQPCPTNLPQKQRTA